MSDNITKERYQIRNRYLSDTLRFSLKRSPLCAIRCNTSLVCDLCCHFMSLIVFPPQCIQGPWDLMTSQTSLWTKTPNPASGTMANVDLSYLSCDMNETICGCRIYKYWLGVLSASVIKRLKVILDYWRSSWPTWE
jgi:hypothetical protein